MNEDPKSIPESFIYDDGFRIAKGCKTPKVINDEILWRMAKKEADKMLFGAKQMYLIGRKHKGTRTNSLHGRRKTYSLHGRRGPASPVMARGRIHTIRTREGRMQGVYGKMCRNGGEIKKVFELGVRIMFLFE